MLYCENYKQVNLLTFLFFVEYMFTYLNVLYIYTRNPVSESSSLTSFISDV